MDYTISIGSNEQQRENLSLARKRLKELFPGIRFSTEEGGDGTFFLSPSESVLQSGGMLCFR